jgi:indole-3-glycerol phosphate synthase
MMDQQKSDVLKTILNRKAVEVAERSQIVSLAALRAQLEHAPAPRGFVAQLRRHISEGRPGVIAEIKRASPSKGIIREDFEPAALARSYAAGGASCLSVLTDHDFFQGHELHLQQARAACELPVLRKDFVIDPYQLYEARVLGADCVLLIVAALGDPLLLELHELAHELGMDVLVEVHTDEELERALALQPQLLGINNRDLHTFHTDIRTTLRLKERVPADSLLVTESGIHISEEVELMRANGVHAFLVGESMMRSPDPGAKLRELFFPG